MSADPSWRAAFAAILIVFLLMPGSARADAREDWITVNKDYTSQRYVDLDQITTENVRQLKPVCEIELNEPSWFTSGLLMVGRTLYASTLRATYAFDAATCELRWRSLVDFKARPATISHRGTGYLDGMIFRGTADGRVIALDAQTGKTIWDTPNADPARRETFAAAPIAWGGKVFIGIATSESGIRGRLMAFDAKTGRELWRFYTVPMGDEAGASTWQNKASAATGGGGFWSTYSLDPATGEVFAPVANPFPDYMPVLRPGDNLYTNSVIALNAATGALNWYYQAVPRDEHDWDLGTAPALYRTLRGKDMLAVAGKNGRVLGIDRTSKSVVFDTPATTIANDGPIDGTKKLVCPGTLGGAQWNGTAYHPGFGALYVGMVDWCWFYWRRPEAGAPGGVSAEPIRDIDAQPKGWITAIDGETGRVLWRYQADAQVIAGLVPTKGRLLFGGDVRGNLLAFDAGTGALLRRIDVGGALNNGLISYAVDGTQYLAAAVGGISLNPSGVAGALRVRVFGLRGNDPPRTVKLERVPELGATPQQAAFMAYFQVCLVCHGTPGRSGVYGSIEKFTDLGEPDALKTFLQYAPEPMPRLYPGLLEDEDIRLIAGFLKGTLGKP